jgi:predicted O-methyltransferase YrrM
MSNELRVVLWYLRRPSLYGEFRRHLARVARRALGRDDERRDQAIEWCRSVATDTEAALASLLGGAALTSPSPVYAERMAAAEARASARGIELPGAANLELLRAMTDHIGATRVIETGVGAGWSSLVFLMSLETRQGARLVSTDMPYPGSSRALEDSVGCVVPPELRDRWTLLRHPDRGGLPRALALLPTIDLCHYDSDKSREGRRWAYPRLWSALRPGGIFVSDDIEDNTAFEEFATATGVRPVVVHCPARKGLKYVGVLVKPLGAGAATPGRR